jgi:hypothetical protein
MKKQFTLYMVRGKRTVLIGTFPNRYRASSVAASLEWNRSWSATIIEGGA